MTISMLAKILPGNAKPLKTVRWPSVAAKFASQEHSDPFFQDGRQVSEIAQMRSEIALLNAELERTRAEADRTCHEASAAGKRDGELATRQALEQQWEGEMTKLRQLMKEASGIGPKLRRQAEEELVRLAVAVARRILHRELTVDVDALTGLVKAAFDRLDQREIQQVRTDAASVAVVEKIVGKLGMPKPVKVIADGSLRSGSLVIETRRGQLDASVETQLQEIERGFTDIVLQS